MEFAKSTLPGLPPDAWGRRPSYLRLSVTDRCNLSCRYCVSCQRQRFIPHDRILRYEEFYRLAAIAARLGIQKLRLTGGEPFCRRGFMEFIAGLRKRFPDLALALTTNATLLAPYIPELAKSGISAVNVSLDSFDAATFQQITGKDLLARVLANIESMLSLGLTVKINAVAMAGITDIQIGDFIHAIRHMPIDLRFIEYMPMGANTLWDPANFLACSDLKRLLERNIALAPVADHAPAAGPARLYDVAGARGRFGFISAVSDHFCKSCNRLRVTSEGRLRLCLFSDREIDLSRILRHPGAGDRNIELALAHALQAKPLGSDILAERSRTAVASGQMVGIGG